MRRILFVGGQVVVATCPRPVKEQRRKEEEKLQFYIFILFPSSVVIYDRSRRLCSCAVAADV